MPTDVTSIWPYPSVTFVPETKKGFRVSSTSTWLLSPVILDSSTLIEKPSKNNPSAVTDRRNCKNQKDSQDYTTPIVPSILGAVLFDPKTERENRADQEDDDGGVLECFKNKGEETFSRCLLVRVRTENFNSMLYASCIAINPTLLIGFKYSCHCFNPAKPREPIHVPLANHVTQHILVNVKRGFLILIFNGNGNKRSAAAQ